MRGTRARAEVCREMDAFVSLPFRQCCAIILSWCCKFNRKSAEWLSLTEPTLQGGSRQAPGRGNWQLAERRNVSYDKRASAAPREQHSRVCTTSQAGTVL